MAAGLPIRAKSAQLTEECGVVQAWPEFFVRDKLPCWTVLLQTRMRVGAEPAVLRRPVAAESASRRDSSGWTATPPGGLAELDESQRARYERLIAWRRATAHAEGIPPYVLFTNAQGLEIGRRAPRTQVVQYDLKGVPVE